MRLNELFLNERLLDISEALRKYVDQPNYFVSYTHDVGAESHAKRRGYQMVTPNSRNASGAKLGINPQSTYETPLAIYTYPLNDEIYQHIMDNTLPFAGDRPFVQVVHATGNVVDLGTMTDAEYAAYSERLRGMFENVLPEEETIHPQHLDDMLGYLDDKDGTVPPPKPEREYGRVFRRLPWSEFQHRVEQNALRGHSAGGKFWAMTYALSHMREITKGRRAPIVWNGIMRSLGIDGCVDSKGEGIIHSSEPMQACFFSVRGLQLVETVRNVRKTNGIESMTTLSSFAQIGENFFYDDDDEYVRSSFTRRFLQQFAQLMSTGKSANFTLAPEFWSQTGDERNIAGESGVERAFDVLAYNCAKYKGVLPALLDAISKVKAVQRPELALTIVNSLAHVENGAGIMRVMRPTAAKVLADMRKEDVRDTMRWITEKAALSLMHNRFFFTNRTPDDKVVEEALAGLTERIGAAKAQQMYRALGHDTFLKIARDAGGDDIPF